MAQMKWKEFSNGKLYTSEEASKTPSLELHDVNGSTITIVLDEAISMSKFPEHLEANLNNQMTFLASCRSAGILPNVRIYELAPTLPNSSAQNILFITGSYDGLIKYFEMFYLPKAESIFENLFHSQDWRIMNAESSIGNVAQKGFGISSLDSFDDLIRRIRRGDYVIHKAIPPTARAEAPLDKPVQPPPSAERKDVGAPSAPAPPRKGWLRSLFGGGAAPHVEARREASAPAAVAPSASSSTLAFTVRSVEVKQSHEYGSESSRSTVTASDAYRILVAEVTFQNTTDRPQRFSSSQFLVLDGKGAVVKASFYGVGDTIAERGAVITTESKTNDAEGSPIVTYKGKLSSDVSFLEWELHPHKSYEDKLVFVIPAGTKGVTVQFTGDS